MIGWGDLVLSYLSCRRVFLQRPDWIVIYCNGLLYVFPTRHIVNFLINFTFLTATYFLKVRYRLFLLKMPLNPNQSVFPFLEHVLPWYFLWLGNCCAFLCVSVKWVNSRLKSNQEQVELWTGIVYYLSKCMAVSVCTGEARWVWEEVNRWTTEAPGRPATTAEGRASSEVAAWEGRRGAKAKGRGTETTYDSSSVTCKNRGLG